MQPVPLVPPFAGINELTPKVSLKTPFAEYLMNFNITAEGLVLRNGDSKYKSLTMAGAGSTALKMCKYGDTKLFAITQNLTTSKIEIFDVDAGTVAYTSAASGSDTFYPILFNKYLFMFAPGTHAPGFYYDGAAYGVIGLTGTGFNPIGGDVFNGRMYMIARGEAAYWYTKPNQVTGAVTKVDLSSVVSESSELLIIAPVSISDNVSSTILQAFVFSSGEVLFYSGSYPNSANWQIVGKSTIGCPLWYHTYLDFQHDAIIPTDTGIVSLRDLFLNGAEIAVSKINGALIQKTWLRLVSYIRALVSNPAGVCALQTRIVWEKNKKRIIISFGFQFENLTLNWGAADASPVLDYGSFYFIYDLELQCWYFHHSKVASYSDPLADLIYYKNKTLGMVEGTTKIMIFQKEGASGFTDRDADDANELPFPFRYTSAPISNGAVYLQKCSGLNLILSADIYSTAYHYLKNNFGNETGGQLLTDPNTANSGRINSVELNLGITGQYIQFKIEGVTSSSKTIGYNLYGGNFYVDAGGSPR